jgi:phage-related protein
LATAATIAARLTLDTTDYDKGMDNALKKASAFEGSAGKALKSLSLVGGGLITVIGGIVTGLGALGTKTGMTAAEIDQLVFVTGQMAENAGWSTKMIEEQRQALRDSGITYSGTEKALQALMAAQLDVSTATDLSRLAQNLAVKTGEDSTATYLALVAGIERADAEMLKSAGMTVDLTTAQQELAKELGKSVSELTTVEKQQAAYNAVMQQSTVYAGLYEGAMAHPIKQMGSLKRLFETLAYEVGKNFAPALSDVIAGFSSFVKNVIEAVSEGGALEPVMQGLGAAFSWLGDAISKAFVYMGENIPAFLEKVQNAWNWLKENEGVIVGIFVAIGAAIGVFVYTVIIPAIASVISAIWPALLIMAAIGLAAYLLYEAWTNNWLGIRDTLINAWNNTIQPALQALWNWLQVVIPIALQFLSDYWKNVLLPAIETVVTWMINILLPIFVSVWEWLSTNLPAAIRILSDYWNNVLLPAIETVVTWMINILLPIFVSVWEWLSTNLPAAIRILSDYWNNVLLPAIEAVWSFFQNSILPILKIVASVAGAVLGVAISALASIWENVLWPALKFVWDFLQNNIFPIIEALVDFFNAAFTLALTALAGLWENVLQPALEKVSNWVEDKVIPIFEALKKFWDDKFGPMVEKVAGWLGEKLQPAFQGIADAVGSIVGFIESLTTKLKNIKLPDWLTPGSPTPFEIGLIGIGKQLDKLSRSSLPKLSTELDLDVPSLPNISGIAGEGGRSETNNFYITSPLREENALTPTQTVKRLSMLYGVN